MRKLTVLLSSLLLLLVAIGCGGGAATAVPTPAQPENSSEDTPDVQPDSPAPTESDVQTVAGKPQLIEFYADW